MKILMITSSLGTGGAETHIASLSRMLRAMGHTVILCSAGGKVAELLGKEGFAHHTLPVDSVNPTDCIRAYRMLCSLLVSERFDVVHAHARIPAYLVGRAKRRLGKRAGFRFCVTCHAAFRVTPGYRKLSDWGDGTIAVSEDLRTYLCDSYDLNPDRVTVVPNGIDCDHFSPSDESDRSLMGDSPRETGMDNDWRGYLTEAAEEIFPPVDENPNTGICVGSDDRRDGGREVLFLSRMDDDCAFAAEQLIRLAPRLRAALGTVKITIAGGGNATERLSPLAKQNGVTLTGETDDPLPELRRCDVFVGVSRAAMEAAAVGKAVILAGNEGYLGVLDDVTRPLAEASNYTCRGRGKPSEGETDEYAERLFYDLSTLLACPDEVLRSLGERNRAAILNGHSVERSAAETVAFYKTLPKPLNDRYLLIGGYYGYGNAGDDAVAEVLVRYFREKRPDLSVALLSRDANRDERRYAVPCFSRTSPADIRRAFGGASAYLMGGGTLFQNLTSERSLSYYLWLAGMAKRRGIPVFMLSGGIGPLHGERAKKRVGALLSAAEHVGVRDDRSAQTLSEVGVPQEKLFFGADPALLLPPADKGRITVLLRRFRIDGNGRYLAVATGNVDGYERAKLSAAVSAVCRRNRLTPLYFPLFGEQDTESSHAVASEVGFGGRVLDGLTPREVLGLLSHCAASLSMRLHLLVFSVSAGIPAVGIGGSDPKIASFSELANLSEPVALPALSPEKIAEHFAKLLERREEICDNICRIREELVKRATNDLETVCRKLPY